MTTLAIGVAQAGIKLGASFALGVVNGAISHALDTRRFEGPRLEQFRVMSSMDGAPLPRAFGRVRLGGQVIWASNLRESRTEEKVGKGGPTQVEYSYTISFAVALCEGVIAGVERIWANGEPLVTAGLTYRVHRGTEDQLPDPVIAAIDGDVPAYRGTAYIVFEDFPLDAYGARLPQINAEVIRPAPKRNGARQDDGPRLEDLVTGVCLLPSSGEFAYHVTPVEEEGLPGAARAINVNSHSGEPDCARALDQLEAQLPNCRSVSIISSWFGTDLRAGACEIHPGVETRERIVLDRDWSVGGLRRGRAHLVGRDADGNPVYGGTPSDASLVELIRELRARDIKVTLYPFILMDVPPGNGLPDPHGGAEQAAYPWRGRIVGENQTDIRAFFGDVSASDFAVGDGTVECASGEFSFRRFILHHAALAAAAGGVDRFLIGSEMLGLTTSAPDAGYPAVAELVALAGEARALLPGAKLSYAADWSEYSGHHVGGDIEPHLDALWASPGIDAVAIDAYFPLSDWRAGDDHLDAPLARSPHDLAYLAANVEGGEGHDWYYADAEDRASQARTPIDHPRFAYKAVRHWWADAHARPDGSTSPWVPESKPVWFTEVGCPAVEFGSNQPNVFVDPKSSESHLPHHSSGRRDDLIQRNYLRAFLGHYAGDPMVEGMDVWCWDARPFPDFPARADVWSDGPNWQLGHWLSGRMGRVALGDVIADVCRDLHVEVDVSGVSGLIEGFVLDRPMSARAALADLCAAFAIELIEAPGRLVFRTRADTAPTPVTDAMRADSPVAFTHAPEDARVGDVRLRFLDGARDHQLGMASGARRPHLLETVARNPREVALPVVMDGGMAGTLAARLLDQSRAAEVEATARLAPDHGLRVGDAVSLPGSGRTFVVTSLEGPGADGTEMQAVGVDALDALPLGGAPPAVTAPVPRDPAPALFAFDLPGVEGLAVGAMRDPFRPIEVEGGGAGVTLGAPVAIGVLATPLPRGPATVVDTRTRMEVAGLRARLDSVTDAAFADGGGHRFAVETPTGWEVIAARDAELVGPDRYRLSHLLRGLHGSDADMPDDGADVPPGARVVHLGAGLEVLDIGPGHIGQPVTLSATAGTRRTEITHDYGAIHLRPLAPVHLSATRSGNDMGLHWIRRTRGADAWTGLDVPLSEDREAYLVELLEGDAVVASAEAAEPRAVFTDAPAATRARVRQGSALYGWGAPATRAL